MTLPFPLGLGSIRRLAAAAVPAGQPSPAGAGASGGRHAAPGRRPAPTDGGAAVRGVR